MAIFEFVKYTRFIREMVITVKLPIIVRTENFGVIFMKENVSSGVRTRHIDTRYHHIRDYVEDGFIKIVDCNY
jgi:hypothetical protein